MQNTSMKPEKICASIMLSILILIFLTVCLRFFIKNIVYEKLHVNNPFVNFFLSDDVSVDDSGIDSEETLQTDNIDWESIYQFDGSGYSNYHPENILSKFSNKVFRLEDKIDIYTNDLLLFQQQCAIFTGYIENCLSWKLTNPVKNDIIYMSNGYLTFPTPQASEDDIYDIANSIGDFNKFLGENNIPLIYANAGTKVCPWNRQIFNRSVEYSNDNADQLIKALKEKRVDVIDYREEILNADLDWYNSYYITDHHWTNKTALWAGGILADRLNSKYDFSFNKKYFEADSYTIQKFKDYWLGANGRRVTLSKSHLEDYDLILPAFDTDLTVSIPSEKVNMRGNYKSVLFRSELFDDIAGYNEYDHMNKPGAYNCIVPQSDAQMTIHNNNSPDNAGKKILLIQDSYGWYLSTYLACDIEETDIIYPASFDGSLRSYIKKSKPDAVVILYNSAQIKSIDWTQHKDLFDFR